MDTKGTIPTPDYNDPAIAQIFQGLSSLAYEENSENKSANSVCQLHSSTATPNNNQSDNMTDRRRITCMSGFQGPSSTHSLVKPRAASNQVLLNLTYPSSPNWLGEGNFNFLLNETTNATVSSRVYYPQPETQATWPFSSTPPQIGACELDSENRFLEHSPGSRTAVSGIWPISPSTVTSKGGPTHPTRQPNGPRNTAHDAGFDWDTYRRLRIEPQNNTESSTEEPQLNQTWIPNSVHEATEPKLWPSLLSNTARESPTQFLPSISARGVSQAIPLISRHTHRPSLSQSGQTGTFTSQSSITSSHSRSLSSGAFNSTYQTASYLPVNSRALVTMSESQNQPSSRTSISIRSPTKPFLPSTMALTEAGRGSRDPARMPVGSKYQGDAFSWSYLRQIPGLPDHLNTSLWLKGLPPDVQHCQLFDIIQCGAVWSLDLKPPTQDHATVAATLTFMTPYAAAIFLTHCQFHGLQLNGYWISASYNKFGIPEIITTESRVLHIEGPPHLMTPQHWELQFKKACRFRMDRWSYLPCSIPGRLRMEFRFVRVDGQAQSCRQMIERELGYLGITVCYGMDPCGKIVY